MTRVRVLHVALQLETGGAERLLTEFARHADRSRFALEFVSMGERGEVAGEIEGCGWPVLSLHSPGGARPGLVFRLAHLLSRRGADIVHTHNTKPLLYAGPAARLAGVRGVIHTRHGQRYGATPRQDRLFRMAARCADRVVCVSDDGRRLCGLGGMESERSRTIRNGVDLDRFHYCGPKPCGPAVYVGRLSAEKDLPTLLRAVALVARDRPDFRLQIAGRGPAGAGLMDMAAALGVSGSVEFLGEVRDVPALLRSASLLVLPSLTEGLPLTVLEAMASGLPVVATHVGGTPEVVHDGLTGLLVPVANPETLAAGLLRVYRDESLSRRMGLAGRRRATEHFGVRSMVRAYESLYDEVLGGGRALAA